MRPLPRTRPIMVTPATIQTSPHGLCPTRNDAPALAAADVGVAMGAAGTQAAIEAADIALMTDDISKIADARAIARRAYLTIQQNLFVGVGPRTRYCCCAAQADWSCAIGHDSSRSGHSCVPELCSDFTNEAGPSNFAQRRKTCSLSSNRGSDSSTLCSDQ